MAMNKSASNLRFLTAGRNAMNGLAGYLQAIFGMTTGVIRAMGRGTVLQGQTTLAIADTGILATDIASADIVTQGANANTQVISIAINAGVGITVTVNQDPGAGGATFAYTVMRPVP